MTDPTEKPTGPPPTWQRWLGWLMPAGQRDAVLGDAEEEFRRRAERDGDVEARRWALRSE